MFDEATIDLRAAAEMLGKSTRQLRRDVRAGRIPAIGGGRGRALRFDRDVLRGLCHDRSVFDADLLARAVHGLHLIQQGATGFPSHEAQCLWMWRREDPLTYSIARDSTFPPLAEVPPDIVKQVKEICADLRPLEIDYLAGMVIARAYPFRAHDRAEGGAVLRALREAMQRDARERERWRQSGYSDAGRWPVQPEHPLLPARPFEQSKDLREAIFSGDTSAVRSLTGMADRVFSVRSYDKDTIPDELDSTLLYASARLGIEKRERGKGDPNGNRVSILLGIQRSQSTRIVRALRSKLGAQRVQVWFIRFLGVTADELPRQWETPVEKARPAEKPRLSVVGADDDCCRACGARYGEFDLVCPGCGASDHDGLVSDKARSDGLSFR